VRIQPQQSGDLGYGIEDTPSVRSYENDRFGNMGDENASMASCWSQLVRTGTDGATAAQDEGEDGESRSVHELSLKRVWQRLL
jgi:hypothetical protein